MIKKILLAAIFAPMASSLFASTEPGKTPPAGVDMEVVEVVGQFSKSTWKNILRDAQKDFFSAFNEVAPFEFDIKCQYQLNETGSRIRIRICQPNFIRINQSKAAALFPLSDQDWRSGAAYNGSPSKTRYLQEINKAQEIELKKLLMKTISEDEELAKKYERFQKAQVAYDMAKD